MPLNLISLIGLFVMILLAWLVSSHRWRVNWRLVTVGVLCQAALAVTLFNSQNWTFNQRFSDTQTLLAAFNKKTLTAEQIDASIAKRGRLDISIKAIKRSLDDNRAANNASPSDTETTFANWDGQLFPLSSSGSPEVLEIPRFENGILFSAVNTVFASIDSYVKEGAYFVFRGYDKDTTLLKAFAFNVLPTVIFFASLMAVLYHLGFMQRLVSVMAWFMQKTLGTSGPESMAAAANVMVGHTEAPLMIRPYIQNMTRSELNALMVGGFATISGSLIAVFVSQGISAGHLVAASLISAPAALVIAKIMLPETETPQPVTLPETPLENQPTNVIEAAALGASEGLKLALNIAAMLIAFLALLAMVNAIIYGVGETAQWVTNSLFAQSYDFDWSLNAIFGTLFYPLAWIMGIQADNCHIAGELLGKKIVVNEFIAYSDMAAYYDQPQGGVPMTERTKVILTYALCGFSNFGAIGIQLGGIGPLAPTRRSDLAQLGLRAMFGGMLAACMTACLAGVMYSGPN